MPKFVIDYYDHEEQQLQQIEVEAPSKEEIETPPKAIVYEQLSFNF